MYGAPPGQPPNYALAPMPGDPQQAGKSGFVTMMLAIGPAILGICGMHRIYTGYVGIGLAQLFTLGGCGIWQLIDIISIVRGKFTDKNGLALKKDHPVRRLM
jgi:hypothetical protein